MSSKLSLLDDQTHNLTNEMMVGSAWPKLLTTAFLFNWLGSQFVYLSKESYLLKAWHACSLLPVRGVDVTSFLLLKRGSHPFWMRSQET